MKSFECRVLLVTAISTIGCASDPARFTPANEAKSYDAVKDAYRVAKVEPECTQIGSVDANRSLDDVAITAARHGGTHYIVSEDKHEVTGYTSSGTDAGPLMNIDLAPKKTRTISARIYRCP
jgi:hypothetical protein